MGKKYLAIADPNDPKFVQPSLFAPAETPKYNPYPRLVNNPRTAPEECRAIIQQGAIEGMIGTDYEFNATRPTIAGFACSDAAGAVRWDDNLVRESIGVALATGATLVGHSVAGAEREQIKKTLGIDTPISLWEDSMIAFHLCNADFTKMSGKDESDDAGALGLMNLWVTASMYTDLPKWKDHRGKYCSGPCPSCRVFDYCAVDSWASLAAMKALKADMAAKQIPHQFYRECMELSAVCVEMQNRGLRVNKETVKKLETDNEYVKGLLFPFEAHGKKVKYAQFNPKSSKEVIEYCKSNSISLPTKRNKAGEQVPSTEKNDIAEVLTKMARREGYHAETVSDLVTTLDQADELTGPLDTILRLYKYKKAGKGAKATFNPKYFTSGDDFLHPRFIQTGTSTGRLASAGPNAQNIDPLAKTAIVPDTDDEDFLESDFSQLELRMCLYLGGIDPVVLGADAFTWMAQNSDGQFTKAAAMLGCDERQVGKRLSHAANYLEGFQSLSYEELCSPKVKTELEVGARAVYRDWEYCGRVVTFTGANLSQALFGDKTLANRKKALQLQEEVYFGKLGMIREWQRKVLAQAEHGYVRSVTGRYLALYGKPDDNAKAAVAFNGQGTGADHVQAVMLRFKRERNVVASMQVHDSLVWSIPKTWTNEYAKEWIGLMQEETWRLPGFSAPGKVKRGSTYGGIKQI